MVRGFPDLTGAPPTPVRDLEAFAAELVLADLAVVEKRLERVRKEKGHEREKVLLERVVTDLEAGRALRTLSLPADERRALAGFASGRCSRCSRRTAAGAAVMFDSPQT